MACAENLQIIQIVSGLDLFDCDIRTQFNVVLS
jgi:hypothetical protein